MFSAVTGGETYERDRKMASCSCWPHRFFRNGRKFVRSARPPSQAAFSRAMVARPATSCLLWVNKELGFAKKYGVDLEIIMIQAGSPNIQALLGGSLQLTQTAASSALLGAVRGAPVVIVATLENELPLQLISRPEIKDPHQLRGKTIGINRFGGSNDAAVLMAVKAWKMDPKDITMLQTGETAARMAALIGKKVDATVQSYPEIFQARKLGMNVLADMGDFGFYTNTSEHRHSLLSRTEPGGCQKVSSRGKSRPSTTSKPTRREA